MCTWLGFRDNTLKSDYNQVCLNEETQNKEKNK